MSEYEQFKADPRFTPSTGTILADKRIAEMEKAGDRMEKAICLYFGKDQLDPMNDARMAWHTLRASGKEGSG